jgi:hypothetical protein
MNAAENTSIHRHLDEAFAGVALTAETQDLKEELRGNLEARVQELQTGGLDVSAAAKKAIKELGDIRALISELEPSREGNRVEQLVARNRVRPKPAFVVAALLLSLVLAGAIATLVLSVLGILDLGYLSVAVTALSVGALTDLSLRQETSQHYRAPSGRAAAFGVAALVGAVGAGLAALFVGGAPVATLIVGVVLAVASIAAFSWLGVTQTNRMKPWVFELNRSYEAGDRFAQDPAAAARFGIYTVVIWVLSLAAFVALTIAIGFAWSWLALVVGLAVFMLTLTRMLFPAEKA